jgi:hypothetical protein
MIVGGNYYAFGGRKIPGSLLWSGGGANEKPWHNFSWLYTKQ